MTRLLPALLSCLVLASCGDEGGREEDAGSIRAGETPKSIVSRPKPGLPDGSKPGTSVMRPSVVAEAGPPATPQVRPATITIRFAERTISLDDEARSALDALLDQPALMAGGRVVIRGHSDSRGHDGDNLVASRKRAEAVRDYLVEKGIAKERMNIVALGEGRPVAPNVNVDGTDNPQGRARNRRVEIEVSLPRPGASRATPAEAATNDSPAT